MADTTNYGWTKPTVGGNEDQWGTITNTIFDEIDTLLGGTSAAEFAILDGITATTSELNFVAGATSAIQTQIDAKAPIADPTFTGTATMPNAAITTAAITTVDFGDWTITEASGVLKFATGGVNKMSLDASGNLTVVGNVNTSGTIA
jgi:GTP cyclohydrolase III